jgi:hypothetical protein
MVTMVAPRLMETLVESVRGQVERDAKEIADRS